MFTRRCLWFLMVIILLLVLIPACGGDDGDDTPTPTATATPAVTHTPTVTATPTATTATPAATPTVSKEPVKIGAICPWSGSAAMAGVLYADPIIKVVEKQVEERGGILGGRPLQIKRYDSEGTVSGALSAATKAIVGDKLPVVALGGISGTEATTVAEVACKGNALFSSYVPIFDVPERECMLEATISMEAVVDSVPALITEWLQPTPKTVAILAVETAQVQQLLDGWKSRYESAGIKTIYEQTVTPGTMDYTPYLTQIKYLNPDVLILYQPTAGYMAVAKQILGLGGWGDIQVVGEPGTIAVSNMPGAEGWLSVTPWYLEMDNPESIKFVKDYKAVVGRSPDISHVYIYLSLWTAIHAMELAGTAEDGKAIIRAARSGELEFDTPMGLVHFNTNGKANIKMTAVRIEKGGNLVVLK